MLKSRTLVVSVIICTFNRQQMLDRALTSVLAQSFDDYEIIIVDDGSDPPVEIRAPSQDRIRLVRVEHQGVGTARAVGLEYARGQFVAYCDDDDVWSPSHLKTLLEYLHQHPDVALVYADSHWPYNDKGEAVPYSFDFNPRLLAGMNYIFPSDVVHRVDAAQSAGGVDPALQAYEDWDLWLRMIRNHRFEHLPVVLGQHHWHSGCVMASGHWDAYRTVYQGQKCSIINTKSACYRFLQSPFFVTMVLLTLNEMIKILNT